MSETVTAEQMVLNALRTLQRGLPPGDLNQREVIAELWGVFDNPAAIKVIKGARGLHSPNHSEPAGQRVKERCD